ncbi:MAG: hypothetical protein IPO40_23535 [Fibrobacteres bacterium]|nr:hypothetical protein [Fibrobacterota bacterium]
MRTNLSIPRGSDSRVRATFRFTGRVELGCEATMDGGRPEHRTNPRKPSFTRKSAHKRHARRFKMTQTGVCAQFCVFPAIAHNRLLGTPPGGILLRDPSAAEQDNVTITFYQLQISNRTQIGRDHNGIQSANYSSPQIGLTNMFYNRRNHLNTDLTSSDSHGTTK